MAQFDVYRNPGQHRDSIPYVVVVQSAVFDDYQRRVVIPLVKKSDIGHVHHARFNPSFNIQGETVVLHPLEIVSVPANKLGASVASLAAQAERIVNALDELFSRAYG
ncbi:CcdB family protein [Solimonas marina]|uniref:Toxin CcdB n=1 Tax=Solimonas marina TaxID=2714601 RepID=A0A969WAP5_9GAMM|nr:CcdB family protein [Solimonas marina]NKF23921.1 plasmid maintenance protein CcdB [Solimonas marina]